MTPIKNISIPKPCHESWQQMTPADQGRHCALCCKTVTDFTSMTNQQIIANLASENNVCGRIDKQQLSNINQQFYAENLPTASSWKRWVMMMSLFGSTMFFKAAAQIKPLATEQAPSGQSKPMPTSIVLGKVKVPDSVRYRTITGCITDENNIKIPGATIRLPLGNTGTIADNNGNFQLHVPVSVTQFTVSYMGYNSRLININADKVCNVKLTEQAYLLGEVVGGKTVVRQPFFKRVYYKCIKNPIRKIFK